MNQRFERWAKRRMQGADWAAWAAVRAIVESVVRANSAEFAAVVERAPLAGFLHPNQYMTPWDSTATTGCANCDELGRWRMPANRRGVGPAVAVDASPAPK